MVASIQTRSSGYSPINDLVLEGEPFNQDGRRVEIPGELRPKVGLEGGVEGRGSDAIKSEAEPSPVIPEDGDEMGVVFGHMVAEVVGEVFEEESVERYGLGRGSNDSLERDVDMARGVAGHMANFHLVRCWWRADLLGHQNDAESGGFRERGSQLIRHRGQTSLGHVSIGSRGRLGWGVELHGERLRLGLGLLGRGLSCRSRCRRHRRRRRRLMLCFRKGCSLQKGLVSWSRTVRGIVGSPNTKSVLKEVV